MVGFSFSRQEQLYGKIAFSALRTAMYKRYINAIIIYGVGLSQSRFSSFNALNFSSNDGEKG